MRTSSSAASAARAGNCGWTAPTSPGAFGGAPRNWRPSAWVRGSRPRFGGRASARSHQERFTSLDRETRAGGDRTPRRCRVATRAARTAGAGAARPPARAARESWPRREGRARRWVLAEDWQRRLRELGERGRHPQADAPCATRRRRRALPRGAARPGAARWPGRRRGADASSGASSARAWATSSTGGRSTP